MGYCPSVYRAITHSTATATLRDIQAMSLRTIQQRVRERLDVTGISMKAASKEVGGETLVRDLLERDREPSATRLKKLAEVLGCSLAYLTGETDALDDGAVATTLDLVSINEHDVRLSAGPGTHVDAEDVRGVWRAPRSFVQTELGVNPAALTMVQVVGDSMEPTLRSGDRVIIDHSDANPARPGIYAIWDGNATVVKRLERVPYSDPPMVVLISDNPNHNPYTVHADLVQVIGRVVWYGRRT